MRRVATRLTELSSAALQRSARGAAGGAWPLSLGND